MLILLRDTDIDGQPIIGAGLMIPGETAAEIAHKIQATSPFNTGDLTAYMRRVLDAAGDDSTLPEGGTDEVASAFLERLARRGLVEFVKDDPNEPVRPEHLDKALTAVRDSGLTNMLDRPVVARLTREFGFPEVADWIDSNPADCARYLLGGGFRPLDNNSTAEGEGWCADKLDS